MAKTNPGRFFEEYSVGEIIRHAVPRTVSGGSARSIMRSIRRAMRCIHRTHLRRPVACPPRRLTIGRVFIWCSAKRCRIFP